MRDLIYALLQGIGFAMIAMSYAIDDKLTLSTKILSVFLAVFSGISIITSVVLAWKLQTK